MSGVVTLAGTLLALVFWIIKEHAAKAADPLANHAERYRRIDADIASGKSLVAGAHASDDLDELDRLRLAKGDPG